MNLPSSWAQVSIAQYLKIHTINQKVDNPTDRGIQIIATLSGEKVSDVRNWKVAAIYEALSKLDFIKTLPEERLPLEFRLDGRKFKAIIFQHEMTGNQFVDYSDISNKVNTSDDIVYQMHNLIACFCIEGKKNALGTYEYEYKGYDKLADFFLEKMPLTLAYPFYVFFCSVSVNLLPSIQAYFQNETMKKMREMKKELVN